MLEALGAWAEAHRFWMIVGVFLALITWESARPARVHRGSVALQWMTNLGLQGANTAILLLLGPAVLAKALIGSFGAPPQPFPLLAEHGGGWWVLGGGFLILDLYAYAFHRLQHNVFTLWRLHAVHHADTELDASTTFRHHPVEVVISTCVGAPLFALLGIPDWVFAIYGIVAIAVSLLQHANAALPERLDAWLAWLIVTPGLHQIHHSVDARDHDGNYGTVLSFWDRLFQSYRGDPAAGREQIAFGVEPFTSPAYARPYWAFFLPLAIRRPVTGQAKPALRTPSMMCSTAGGTK